CRRVRSLINICQWSVRAEYRRLRHCEERQRRSNPGHCAKRLDCFAEPVIGPATPGRTRWLAMTNRAERKLDQPAVLAALAASHHQTFGKAARPYFGIGSGWPKRSQRAVRALP